MSALTLCRTFRGVVPATLAIVFTVSLAPQAAAQNVIDACYVEKTGVLYLIDPGGTRPGNLPMACTKQDRHIQFAWVDGAGAIQADGITSTTNGFAVTGTPGTGTIPASGPGARLMWYPGKAAFRAGFVNGNVWDDASVGAYSIAAGYGAVASGEASAAFGLGNLASGSTCIAMGYLTKANGTHCTAMGSSTEASGGSSTAMGADTKAGGSYSTALGHQSVASATASTAMGGKTQASGSHSTAMGDQTKASGDRATAMGLHTEASNFYATAMGLWTIASGNTSTAMGSSTKATGSASTALGAGTVAGGDYSTAIGFQTNATGNYSIAMGYQTEASGRVSTAMGQYASTAGFGGTFVYGDVSTSATGDKVTATAGNQFVVRASGGTKFYSISDLSAGVQLAPGASAWATVSDRNRKHHFQDVSGEDVLAKIANIPIPSWSYRAQDDSIRHIGPMAQDFYAAFRLGTSDLTITTSDISGVNMRAIQALEQRTRELDAMRAKVANLEDRLAALEAALRGQENRQP